MSGRVIHRAAVFNPAASVHRCEVLPDAALMVEGGKIVSLSPFSEEAARGARVVQHPPHTLLSPGFVDAHVHFPQTGIIASHGEELLTWLQKYAFAAERRFGDANYAAGEAEFFLRELMAAGTTTALVFATVHRQSADALFAAAHRRRLRLISGKTLMDCNAPADLLDTAQSGYDDSAALIRKWHGRGRLGYAVTPRFAITSTPAQLEAAGRLLREHPDAHLHTHLSENHAEVDEVARLFPDHPHYVGVYEAYGLLTRRSVFAHSIHLSNGEWRRLAQAGSAAAFCPLSNMFLGSGLFNFPAARRHGVRVGLGSDVGGGDSLSLLRVMNGAYKAAKLRGDTLSAAALWRGATLEGARALDLDGVIGDFSPGKEADFVALDGAAAPLLARRLRAAEDDDEKMFALAMMGESGAVRATYILGEEAHRRGEHPPPPEGMPDVWARG